MRRCGTLAKEGLLFSAQRVAAHTLRTDGPSWRSLSPGALESATWMTGWPPLPVPIRVGILALVQSCQPASGEEFQWMTLMNCGIHK